MLQELSDESRRIGFKMNIAKTKVMVVDNTPINVNNVLIEMFKATRRPICDNTTASGKRTRTKRYNEESWQAGRHNHGRNGNFFLAGYFIEERHICNYCFPTKTMF